MKKILLPLITKALNSYLKLDPESKPRLQGLQNKVVTLELLPFGIIFQCFFTPEGVEIETEGLLEPETHIRGTPLQLMGLMLAKEDRQRFFADDVEIKGNAELGFQVIALFDELSIDWQEYLSKVVGDVPAYHSGRVVQRLKGWLSDTHESIRHSTSEFIQEEATWLPAREAVDDFFHDIDSLRLDVDRIEARIAVILSAAKDLPK